MIYWPNLFLKPINLYSYGRRKKIMKKWVVTAVVTKDCEMIIEAETEDEAWDIACQADGADFDEVEHSGSWRIDTVEKFDRKDSQ